MASPTNEGVNLIKQFEGFREDAYADPLSGWAVPTIGYGTTVYTNGKKVAKGDKITEPQATNELKAYVTQKIAPALAKLPFYAEMTNPQIGALECFAYNLGPNFYGMSGFETISRRLKDKDWKSMRSALMLYVNPGTAVTAGLTRRRAAEADLWELGLKQIKVPVMASTEPVKPIPNNANALKPGYLSANFTLQELIVSQTAARMGIYNFPGQVETANLKRLCETCLQPLRDKLGKPVVVSSGYRGPAVNSAVGGSQTSAHMFGRAADIHVPGMKNSDLMEFVYKMGLPVDQVIEEFGSWVHIGIADTGKTPRNEYLIARMLNGSAVYSTARF